MKATTDASTRPTQTTMMSKSPNSMPRHESSHERRASSTGKSALTRAASGLTRSRRARRSVTGGGLAGQHALLDHLVGPDQHRRRDRDRISRGVHGDKIAYVKARQPSRSASASG